MEMKVTLSKPPSTNSIYGLTNRTVFASSYITKRGRDWFEQAGWELREQRLANLGINEPCEVWIKLYTCRFQDGDGIVKPLFDLLEKMGVVTNDVLIFHHHVDKELVAHIPEQKIELKIEVCGHQHYVSKTSKRKKEVQEN